MFAKILQWIREVIQKMIGQSSVKQALNVDVAISSVMAEALNTWSLMYKNEADWLSDYVKSLNLAAAVSGEIARLVTIEMDVEISGSARADYLNEQFERMEAKLREKVEQGCAKGGMMLKPYISGEQIAVDFVQADQFYPVSFDSNGNITACVFVDQRTVGSNYYTRLEYHMMTEQGCEIRNMAYRSSSQDTLGQPVPLGSVAEWASIEPQALITGINKPLYAYFRYPLANNIDPLSPLGVSCYSRAVDLIEDADTQWSSLMWEFESGKRAIFVDVLAFGKDSEGNPKLPDRRLYRTLETGSAEGELYHEWTPEFRDASIRSGLDAILKRIEYNCGLAYGTLSDPQTVDKTATEIKTSKQRTYATIVDTQKALEDALEELIYAMDVWATLGNLAPAGTYQTVYDFDDSVIVDKDMQFQQDLRLVNQGIMGKVEFRMRNFGESEEIARAKIAEILAEQPAIDLFGSAA
jgi:A118 family predicted phage portal protein